MSKHLQRFLFITGFMGSGKTSLSKELSIQYNCPLYELDNEIELAIGKDIPGIFSTNGETFFRKVESETLQKIIHNKTPGIVSTGGGVVISPNNRKFMRNNGYIIWITVPPGEIVSRLQIHKLHRPLATKNGAIDVTNLLELYRNRIPAYLQCHRQISGLGSKEMVLTLAIQCIDAMNNLYDK
jgi:shikimate kinase